MRWLPFRIPLVLGFGLLAGSVAWQPALAQIDSREGIALQNQVAQLRQEVQQLRDQLSRGGGGGGGYTPPQPVYRPAPSGDIVTQLLTRVDALEERVRDLRGQVDQTQHAQQQMAADLGKRIDDLAFQGGKSPSGSGIPPSQPYGAPTLSPPGYGPNGDGSGGGGPGGGSSGRGGPNGAGFGAPPAQVAPPTPVRRTPEVTLQEGNAALTRRDYAAAEAAAREVLSSARTSPRAYDAQYLLAQALAGQRQYAQSAIAYDDAYNRNRKGSHAPDALVGLASTLTSLNEKKAACDTLVKLGGEFPQLRPDLRDDVASTRQRAGCR